MIIEDSIKLDFKDVLIKPKRSPASSRRDIFLLRDFTFRNSKQTYSGIPLIASNLDTIGTPEMADDLNQFNVATALHKHLSVEELVAFYTDYPHGTYFYSIGTSAGDTEKLEKVIKKLGDIPPYICIDVANGYSEHFSTFVRKFRSMYPEVTIMAGNVVTSEMTEQLILDGADIVKVGIGPGSVCTTRKQTGVGYPQLSAIIECADAAHGLGGLVCADGGCTIPGDIAKAYGAGADFVMLGGMFAGHDQCGGKKIYKGNKFFEATPTHHSFYTSAGVAENFNELFYYDPSCNQFYSRSGHNSTDWELCDPLKDEIPTHMEFYGMASKTAMDKHNGGVADYRSSEGKTVLVPYRGDVRDTVQDILGGLRSACSYVGATKLKHLSKCTTFVRVTQQINNIFS